MEAFWYKGGHILAHDMGDSVTTEILLEMKMDHAKLVSSWGQELPFTNGSMVLGLADSKNHSTITWKNVSSSINSLYKVFKQQARSWKRPAYIRANR